MQRPRMQYGGCGTLAAGCRALLCKKLGFAYLIRLCNGNLVLPAGCRAESSCCKTCTNEIIITRIIVSHTHNTPSGQLIAPAGLLLPVAFVIMEIRRTDIL